MSMEREYIVIVNKGIDLAAFDADLAASTGSGAIPNRSVDIANARLGSKRMTHWMLTDEEANTLRSDPRVLEVEIPVEQQENLEIGLRAFQSADFQRGSIDNDSAVNWGLLRTIKEVNPYTSVTETPDERFEYALDGTGVDIVIQDTGIEANHPEWQDANGVSRLQQIDWYTASGLPGTLPADFYTDYHGHGTHCAGIAAGKTYGHAKNARIYAQKLDGLQGPTDPNGGMGFADAFDAIRLWHTSKNGSRPTVVNMSWGFFRRYQGNPLGGMYRGNVWTWGVDYNSNQQLLEEVGVVPPRGIYRYLVGNNAQVDVDVEEMIDAGIHICIAAGNDYSKGPENYYHRPGSPYNNTAFNVGNIDDTMIDDNGTLTDTSRASSRRGPGVNIWAPGGGIMSSSSNVNVFSNEYEYPGNASFKVSAISGTSMSSPQVAGVLAQYLQVKPNLTPVQALNKLISDSKDVIFTTDLDNDYENFSSLQGSPNRLLFSRYGKQPYNISGSLEISFE